MNKGRNVQPNSELSLNNPKITYKLFYILNFSKVL